MMVSLRSFARWGSPIVLSAVGLGGVLLAAPARAQATSAPIDYALTAPSAYSVGCFGACACAVRTSAMDGTFALQQQYVDPLYTHYAVENFRATIHDASGAIAVTGSGTYRVGGEVALTQELQLTLAFPDGSSRAFDSGIVPLRVSVPAISVQAAMHGFACVDSVVEIDAKPLTAGAPPPEGAPLAVRAAPNPFRHGTEIAFSLPHRATVDVAVVDLQGRGIATLARGRNYAAGPHTLAWDGKDSQGTPVRAGIYMVVVRVPDGSTTLRLVRLK